MDIKVIREDQACTHVALSGSLDVKGVGEIDVKFNACTVGRQRPTIVDLSEVVFVASLGLGMLVNAAKGLDKHGQKMVLLNPQEMVAQVLEAAGITRNVPIVNSLDDACRTLGIDRA
jgi:anti-anti-sigma factor